MSAPTATRLLSLSTSAVRKTAWLVVPMVVGEALVTLLALIPGFIFLARGIVIAQEFGAAGKGGTVLGILSALFERGLLWTVGVGALLAAAGAFLVQSLVHAGAVKTLSAAQTQGDTDESFARGILEDPARWLLTAVLVLVLRVVAFASAFGMVVVGMVLFQTHPGASAALLMTIATGALVVQPLLQAALELGFVRAVVASESPITAVGEALRLAWRSSSALVPAWALCVVIQLAVSIGGAITAGVVEAIGLEERIRLLVLGPRVAVWIGVTVVSALVTLWRLGVFTALVGADAGWIPEPVPPRPPVLPVEPPPVPAEPGSAEAAPAPPDEPIAPDSPPKPESPQ